MSPDLEAIAEKALMLSSSARAHLAEILLESLDFEEDFAVSSEWMTEILRRCQEIDSGDVELLDGDEAMSALQKKYA